MTDTDAEFDPDDAAGGTAPIVIAAVLAALVVTLISRPMMGLNWTQALLTGGLAGVVAALAAVLGRRHFEAGRAE